MSELIPLRELYSQDLIEAVGLLFLAASSTEAALSLHAARCISHPNPPSLQTHLSTVGMEAKLKLQTIEYCIQLCARDAFPKIEKITRSIRRLYEHRNYVAHNFSIQRPNHIEVYVLKMARKGPVKNKLFTAAQLEGYANLFHARVRQLDECLNELGIAHFPRSIGPVPSPQEHRPPRSAQPNDQAR